MLYRITTFISLFIAFLAGTPQVAVSQATSPPHTVTPVAQSDETHPIVDLDVSPRGERLGDADDPAIWVHPSKPERSLVIATLKQGGLEVYNMDGEVVQSIDSEPGKPSLRYNNVALMYGFRFGANGKRADLAVVTDRANDQLVFYRIDPEAGQLTNVTPPGLPRIFTEGDDAALEAQTTAYGLGVWKASKDEFYAFVSQRSSNVIAQFRLYPTETGVNWERVRTLTLPIVADDIEASQVEGMVVDQEMGILYAAQEQFAIWRFDAAPNGSTEGTIVDVVAPNGEHLQPDVEGLAIYYGEDGKGYLIASSQGDKTFSVYDRQTNVYQGSFTVVAPRGAALHTVEECDGADVVNVSLGPNYPKGLLVVQDGQNFPPILAEDDGEIVNVNTNFKFVRWDALAAVFAGGLAVDTESFNPRKPDHDLRDDDDEDDDDDD